jgi:acetyl esterase
VPPESANPANHAGLPMLEPVTQQFIDGLASAPAIHTLSPGDARSVLVALQSAPVGQPGVQVEDLVFPVGPTGSVPARTVRPAGTSEPFPAIMYFHGGSWILRNRATHDRLVREIAVGVGAAVVFVEYDRAPEARYPVAIEQVYASTRYVVDHGPSLRIDPLRLAPELVEKLKGPKQIGRK